jgi:hypothetical protein
MTNIVLATRMMAIRGLAATAINWKLYTLPCVLLSSAGALVNKCGVCEGRFPV